MKKKKKKTENRLLINLLMEKESQESGLLTLEWAIFLNYTNSI